MQKNMSYHDLNDRQNRPPTGSGVLQNYMVSHNTQTTKDFTNRPQTLSPHSEGTQLTTPPVSPMPSSSAVGSAVVAYGPLLLPKIRTQDQALDGSIAPEHHNKPLSSATVGYAPAYNHIPHTPHHGTSGTRSMTPPDYYGGNPASTITPVGIMTPASTMTPGSGASYMTDIGHLSPPSPFAASGNVRQRPVQNHSRDTSGSSSNLRARSGSPCYIDNATLNRYAYPTYRGSPSYIPNPSTNASYPGHGPNQLLNVPYQQPVPATFDLPTELPYETYAETTPTTTLHDYLTAPNPSPSLVPRQVVPSRNVDSYFWWDVRNIRPWDDFNLKTIQSIPDFTGLLEFHFPQSAFPAPGPVNTSPDSLAKLHDIHSNFYCTKVNAALKATSERVSMCPSNREQHTRQQPDFICNPEWTMSGEPRGRVVGLVRGFEQWNTGMQSHKKVDYLRELAHLQHCMRTYSCRYGFIITEIELVCVRMGTETIPNFGYLELSPIIQLATHGRGQLTACMALWYLHMLATDVPLFGQCGYSVNVGGAMSLTRQKHLPLDDGLLKPEGREKRDAKRNRGWVFPNEPFNRKEGNQQRKGPRTR